MDDKPLRTITLETLADGAAAELFQAAVERVLANIEDPNTDVKPKRAIRLDFIKSGDVRETIDDGISQTVQVAKTVTSQHLVENKVAPSRVTLSPFRTFREVIQPASAFVLRMASSQDQQPTLLLAEADGGAWRLEAVARIADWLRTALMARDVKTPVIA